MRTRPLEPSKYLISFGNLFFDREMQVRKRRPHASQDIFQSFQAGALAWKRNLFYDILPDELRGGVNLSLVDAFFNEAIDDRTVGYRRHGSPYMGGLSSELYRAECSSTPSGT